MTRIALLLLVLLWPAAAPAESLVSVRPEPHGDAWWLRADFHALHTELRGIPVARLRKDWCKATEFTRELFPKELLVEDGTDLLAQAQLAFSVDGAFDGSSKKQAALVGVYETCAGQKGRFLLILDAGTQNVRFLDAQPSAEGFSALHVHGRELIVVYCLECDVYAAVRWDAKRKRFVMK